MRLKLLHQIRTNNFHDEQVMDKIKGLWEEASSKLTDHKGNVYGIYYDYENNYKGDYSLGVATEEDGATMIEIPTAERYKTFYVDHKDDQAIMKTWSEIWNLEEEGKLNRAYTVV